MDKEDLFTDETIKEDLESALIVLKTKKEMMEEKIITMIEDHADVTIRNPNLQHNDLSIACYSDHKRIFTF